MQSMAADDIKVSGKNEQLSAVIHYADTTGIVNGLWFVQNT